MGRKRKRNGKERKKTIEREKGNVKRNTVGRR